MLLTKLLLTQNFPAVLHTELSGSPLWSTGGYYLTTLYASLYYISSFQPRLAARQLSVEAQNSLDQWHRRRTLHCNQSRRSKNRRTIRRQQRGAAPTAAKRGSVEETATQAAPGERGRREESGEETDSAGFDEGRRQAESAGDALQPSEEEMKS